MSDIEFARQPLDFPTVTYRWKLLAETPSWEEVRDAASLLATSLDLSSSRHEEAAQLIDEFLSQFERNSSTLAAALVAGAALGCAASGQDDKIPSTEWIRRGVAAIVTLLGSSWQENLSKVESFLQERYRFRIDVSSESYMFNRDSVDAWEDFVGSKIATLSGTIRPESIQAIQARAWNKWRDRLRFNIYRNARESPFDATLDDLLCATAFKTPATVLELNPSDMVLRDWSRALVHSLAKPTQLPNDSHFEYPCPVWLAVPALRELGIPREGAEFLGIFQSQADPTEAPADEPNRLESDDEDSDASWVWRKDESIGAGHHSVDVEFHYPEAANSSLVDVALLISDSEDGGAFAGYKRTQVQNREVSAIILTTPDLRRLNSGLLGQLESKELKALSDNIDVFEEEAREAGKSDFSELRSRLKKDGVIIQELLKSVRFVAVDVSSLDKTSERTLRSLLGKQTIFQIYRDLDQAHSDSIQAAPTLERLFRRVTPRLSQPE